LDNLPLPLGIALPLAQCLAVYTRKRRTIRYPCENSLERIAHKLRDQDTFHKRRSICRVHFLGVCAFFFFTFFPLSHLPNNLFTGRGRVTLIYAPSDGHAPVQ
jgi:hypothetical protein